MRIVSGKYRSRRFVVPKSFKARPTTDFAKENIFNVLSNLVDFEGKSVLDLFSGTGSIAFEFLSRGCKEAVCVERDSLHYNFIRKVQKELNESNLTAIKSDVFRFLESCSSQFDIIFADPPYSMPDFPAIADLVTGKNILTADGIFILEHPKEYDFSEKPRFLQHRSYGAVNFSIFEA